MMTRAFYAGGGGGDKIFRKIVWRKGILLPKKHDGGMIDEKNDRTLLPKKRGLIAEKNTALYFQKNAVVSDFPL